MDAPGVDLQGGQTARQIGTVHGDAPVEAAGTQQGLVQHLRAVGGAQNDDALAGIEAVQLRQQLVQGLLPLVVAAAEAAAVAGFADGVDLVDEDDAGRHLGGLLEQVTDTAGPHAHEHLHKVRAGDGEEGDVGLPGHGLGQQGFAGARRAHQQGALGELGADLGVFAGVVEKINDLHQGLLGLVLTGHVREGDAGGFLHVDLGIGLAHAAQAPHAAAHPAHQEDQQAHHQDHGHHIAQQQAHEIGGFLLHGGIILHIMLFQQGDQAVVPGHHRRGDIPGGAALLHLLGQHLRQVLAASFPRAGRQVFLEVKGIFVAGQLHGGHLVLLHHLDELGVGNLLGAGVGNLLGQEIKENDQDQGPENGPENKAAFARALAAALALVVWIGTQQYLSSVPGERPRFSGLCHLRAGYPTALGR